MVIVLLTEKDNGRKAVFLDCKNKRSTYKTCYKLSIYNLPMSYAY